MEWYLVILLFFVILLALIFFGVPIAFSFLITNIILTSMFIGFESGLLNLINSSYDAVVKFSLTTIPLYILMGEILFHSGIVMNVLDSFSKVLGKVPARLSVIGIGTGTLFSAMSGSALADTAMLGSVLTPEMMKRGYHVRMIVGPLVAAGSLALIIPPSAMAILYGSLARISVGDLLIAGTIPGIMIAILTLAYYMTLGKLRPDLAPAYDVESSSFGEKVRSLLVNAVPVTILIVIVLGLLFSGKVTPTESAAVGALGAILLTASYRKLNLQVMKTSVLATIKVVSMILLIIAMSAGFSQLLAYTGATRAMVNTVLAWDMPPLMIVIAMLLIVFVLGMFIDVYSIMAITIPLYMPVVLALEFDVIWFGICMLVFLGLGNITPPFGLLLFIIKGVVPPSVTIKEIYKAVIAVIVIQIIAVVIFMIFPDIVTWLPSILGD